jgi:serine/threonine-protein kinase
MESNDRAIEYFQRALQEDPNMALAWAGLASALAYKTGFDDADFTAGYEEARSSALRALEINPDLPEAYIALAEIQAAYDWDWEAAEASLNRAFELRPGDTKIRRELALLKALRGKVDEAFAEYQRVVELDPLDIAAQRSLANALSARGRFDEALQIFNHIVETEPNRPVTYWSLGSMWLQQGDYQQALDAFAREPYRFLGLTGEAIAHHHLQQRKQAAASLQTLISTMGESAAYQIAAVYAQWGDADNAMSWLERAFVIRDPGLQYVGIGFLFDPIKDNPSFQAFLQKMNF